MSTDSSAVERALVKVQAFRDLPEPVIFTSGELGIYYINTEKLLQDDGAWEEYGNDSVGMMAHCLRLVTEKPDFAEVIRIMTDKCQELFPADVPEEKRLIAGGQRRDWLFSCPIAAALGLNHVSLFKDGSACLLDSSGAKLSDLEYAERPLEGFHIVHVVDLLTVGSSVYNPKLDPPKGWVTYLRDLGGSITDVVAVVDRLQGASETLSTIGVAVTAFAKINAEFMKEHSTDPDIALAHLEDSKKWNEGYLRENGALRFIDTFDPEKGKVIRGKKFVDTYSRVLAESGHLAPLCAEVSSRFGYQLVEE